MYSIRDMRRFAWRRYATRWAMIHITTACICSDQYWKSGHSVRSNMYFGWTCRNAVVIVLVQFQITGPTTQRVILCSNLSVVPQREHDFCGIKLIADNRSLDWYYVMNCSEPRRLYCVGESCSVQIFPYLWLW